MASKRTKPPIEKAIYQIEKQIQAVQESHLGDRAQAQLVDWLTGLKRTMETVEQVVDPDAPPSADSAHGALIALGKRQRTIASVLGGGASSTPPSGDVTPPAAPPSTPSASEAPQGAPAQTPAESAI